ncbi:sugar phosphate isomerase/epimerase family protein [Paramicrobacterium agarici]|uniref:sugar phosphate isomerase/epimerase family protein n=1 Tax=Paramicrobacterium agarici TaxID=630514 RepID=UPI0011700B14|nr:TIM barrel protein [Microbacterium agarici]TQO22095.1 sugar phosphate isomerase/epimerase [Microbacterium agarici]
MTAHIRAGLCSVTFRAMSTDDVIAAARDAELESIEWGTGEGEHLVPGDREGARRLGERTRAAGLAVASLGGYYRCGDDESITPLLDSAVAAGAPRVRVWAGSVGSAEADEHERQRIASRLRDAVGQADAHGIELALEYHGRTLTDTAASTLSLLESVGMPQLSSYWQPTQGAADDAALAEFDAVAPHVSTVHVFSWWPMAERLRLSERHDLWHRVFARAASLPRITDALLEFVPNDDPALLPAEAATLRSWLDAA